MLIIDKNSAKNKDNLSIIEKVIIEEESKPLNFKTIKDEDSSELKEYKEFLGI